VDTFIRSVGTPEGARTILVQRINSELGAAIGQMELDDLISAKVNHVDEERAKLRQRLLDEGSQPLRETARKQFGIEVVDIRLRRANHPEGVRQAIFDRINSERERRVAEYQSKGQQEASRISSENEFKVNKLRAEAEAEAVRLRGQADAEADRIRNTAAQQDPQFYAFLRKLDDYQRILGDNKTMLLLSTHREIFDTLFQPPSPDGKPTPRKDSPANPMKEGK
jgi:membrane protease subunit HflC